MLGLLLVQFLVVGLDAQTPPRVRNAFTLMEVRVGQPISNLRIQIMRIPAEVSINPAPAAESFEKDSIFVIMLDPAYFEGHIKKISMLARESRWAELGYDGYPRWRFKILGSWNESVGDFLIDETNDGIFFDGTWYKVDKDLVGALTGDLLKLIFEKELGGNEPHKPTKAR